MMVIWDATTGVPVEYVFKLPSEHIVSMDMSKNCNFIAMLCHQYEEDVLTGHLLSVYEWKKDQKAERLFVFGFQVLPGEVFDLLRFNPNRQGIEMELLVNSKSRIFFCNINLNNTDDWRFYFPAKTQSEDKIEEDGGDDMNIHKNSKSDKNKTISTLKNDKSLKKNNNDPKSKITETNNITNANNNSKAGAETTLLNSKHKSVYYTQSSFLNNSSMAITATNAGYVIVWDTCEALCKEDDIKSDRRKIKTVQLLKYKKDMICDKDIINFLINYQEFIVIGSGDGAIKFYNYSFIIVRWFENVCWLVTSISFDLASFSDENYEDYNNKNLEKDSNNIDKFKCIPFITSDISAAITRVYHSKNDEIDYNDDLVRIEVIYQGIESGITTIAVHPIRQCLAFATDSKSVFKKRKEKQVKEILIREKKFEFKPYVEIFYFPDHMRNIKEELKNKEEGSPKKLLIEREKDKTINKNNSISRLKLDDEKYINPYKRNFESIPNVVEFSLDGKFLMVGTEDEKIYVLSTDNLWLNVNPTLQIKDITENDLKGPIKEIVFSEDEKHFAARDNVGRIGLFKNENPFAKIAAEKKQWTLIARYHFKNDVNNPIISLCFSENSSKLYAINKDKNLYEFDISNTSIDNFTLTVKSKIKIEYDCNLTSIVLSPSKEENNLIISNDEYKIRTIAVPESLNAEPFIKQTSLGPCYGDPIKKLIVIPSTHHNKQLLAFSTTGKIFGLIHLPIDGNPHRYMGVIGHPKMIHDIKSAKFSNYIITTGGKDMTINGWKYYSQPLNSAVKNSTFNNKGDLDTFLSLLEGGKDGLKYQEMIDFFYYAQIKSKDENTTKHRILNDTVPKDSIHGLFAAMNFYPSEKDLNNIKSNEIKSFRNTDILGKSSNDSITFDMFVRYD